MGSRIQSASTKNQYSSPLGCRRLKNIQALLRSDGQEACLCDGILAVLGVDSKFNEGCREFANYLTRGFFSSKLEDGVEEEDMEDVIMLVQENSVSVYCSFALYPYLLPKIGHWKNLQVYCKSVDNVHNRDTDAEEAYKVCSFISMMQNCESIGVPYLASAFFQNNDKKSDFSIDSWPLIQSSASDDIGCGKSFTSRYKALNVRDKVMHLYNECSPFVLEKIVESSYPLFKRHWDEALGVVNNAARNKNLLQLKEDKVFEPLLCYFKHGRLSKTNNKQSGPVDPMRKPFVLFGKQTAGMGKENQTISLKDGARKGLESSTHMILRNVSPNGPLSCTRTYFFRSGAKNDSAEFDKLVHLYTVCTQGCSLAIEEYVSTLSIPKAESKSSGHLLSKGISCGLVFDAKCSITACDKVGRKVKVQEGRFEPYVYNIQVGAENIKASHGGDVIGSVVFADTFVISSFTSDVDDQRNTICNVLTSSVPSFIDWRYDRIETITNHPGEDPLALCKDVTVCSASDLYSPPSTVSLQFNKDGSMVLSSCNMDDILLKTGALYFDSPTPGEVCLIIVSFDAQENAQFWPRVPPNFRGGVSIIPDVDVSIESKCMILGLMPGTTAYKEFYAVVVYHIQNETDMCLPIKKAKAVSEDVQKMFNALQSSYKQGKRITKTTFSKSDSAALCSAPAHFIAHLSLATVVQDYKVPGNIADDVLKKKTFCLQDSLDEELVPVTIISGHPSSGADDISKQLVNLNKEKVRWVIIRPTLVDAFSLNRLLIEDQLTQAVHNKRVSRPSAAARKKLRIVVVATGFFDLCEIIQCISNHSDENVRKQLSIGSVTYCVNPKSTSMFEMQNYPKFFDQCLPGVVNNFAFVTEDEENHGVINDELSDAQALVRYVNKQAAFINCLGGKLVRKNDFDMLLAEDSFAASQFSTARFLLRPELHSGQYLCTQSTPAISKLKLEFSQPLLKCSFSARLRGLKSSIAHPQPFGSVCFVSGCVAFTDSPKLDYDVTFSSANKEVSIIHRDTAPNQPAPPSKSSFGKSKSYYLEFYGINLKEEELKDWMRKCGRQKPSKKSHKTKNRLSKSELQRIHDENSTRRLPEGYFYNGSFYVSLFDNKKMMQHPYMAQFIDEYLAAENEEIDAYNAEIEKQNIKDMFE